LLGLNWGYQVSDRYSVSINLHERLVKPKSLSSYKIPLDSVDGLVTQLSLIEPDVVIHTAGITSIEVCEKNNELADHVNTRFPINICKACKQLGIPLVHISTDNLFDGTIPLVNEEHSINPLNYYGVTKARAEEGIMDCYSDVLIIRTNFFGWGPTYKPSFSDAIINALRQGKTLSLFEDVFYTPILMSDLINTTHELLENGHRGVFNVVGDERLSKHAFGCKLANIFDYDITLINSGRLKDMKALTTRPYDMSMSNEKVTRLLGRSIGNIDAQLVRLKQEENLTRVRAIHEIDSLR